MKNLKLMMYAAILIGATTQLEAVILGGNSSTYTPKNLPQEFQNNTKNKDFFGRDAASRPPVVNSVARVEVAPEAKIYNIPASSLQQWHQFWLSVKNNPKFEMEINKWRKNWKKGIASLSQNRTFRKMINNPKYPHRALIWDQVNKYANQPQQSTRMIGGSAAASWGASANNVVRNPVRTSSNVVQRTANATSNVINDALDMPGIVFPHNA